MKSAALNTEAQFELPSDTNTDTRTTARTSGCPLHGMLGSLPTRSLFTRAAVAVYGLASYGVFFGTFLYAIGFVTGLFVPKTLSSGEAAPLLSALMVNGGLLGAFAVQHTIMARKPFKRWLVRFVPEAIERSTFVLAASLILIATFAFWRPMPQLLWEAPNGAITWMLTGISLLGFGIVLYGSFLINHFELFGLRQVATHFMGRRYIPVGFRVSSLYRIVRHPLMLGFIIAFWATPILTVGHLFFALMTTGYIVIGVMIEERDLIADHGQDYLEYKARVRGLLPVPVQRGTA